MQVGRLRDGEVDGTAGGEYKQPPHAGIPEQNRGSEKPLDGKRVVRVELEIPQVLKGCRRFWLETLLDETGKWS